jgi:hypothetical protein
MSFGGDPRTGSGNGCLPESTNGAGRLQAPLLTKSRGEAIRRARLAACALDLFIRLRRRVPHRLAHSVVNQKSESKTLRARDRLGPCLDLKLCEDALHV